MATAKFTDIKKTNATVQLRVNTRPTLPRVDWTGFGANNAPKIQAKPPNGRPTEAWVLGGDANQTITAATGLTNYLDGAGGNDSIVGSFGIDWLYGGIGNDTLRGGDGDDRLSGGTGNDVLSGGNNDDWLYGDEGNDRLVGDAGNDTITGGDGDDTIFGDTPNNDTNSGADVIFAGTGNDNASGGLGNDIIYGDSGNDTLSGDKGNDTLVGGTGQDMLTGGEGADAFVFRILDAKNGKGQAFTDTITDFEIGKDRIWLEWADYQNTVTSQRPLNISATADQGGGTLLKFDFTSNGVRTDYQIILRNIAVESLGTDDKLVNNLNKIFIVYENSQTSFS